MIFFTADHHFGHENLIVKYHLRPFTDVDEMDEVMIAKWNEVVSDDDVVYHLGDFTLEDEHVARKYFARLNGRICVLANMWHHDRQWLPYFNILGHLAHFPKLARWTGARSASGHRPEILPALHVLELPELGSGKHPLAITLCHYPLAVWDRKHYGAWHLHGHCHGQYQGDGYILDVGVDSNDFAPVSLDSIIEKMKARGWTIPSPATS